MNKSVDQEWRKTKTNTQVVLQIRLTESKQKQINYIRLRLCRSSCHIANAILTAHLPTMSDFNFQTANLLRELHTLRIGQSTPFSKSLNNMFDIDVNFHNSK